MVFSGTMRQARVTIITVVLFKGSLGTDLSEMERNVRSIVNDGLKWGACK